MTAAENRLADACKEMASVIKDAQIPEPLVRRLVSFEVAEFIYNGEEFWHRYREDW